MMKILMFFVNILLNQIQNCSVQIKKMKDRIFSFQMKKTHFWPTLTDIEMSFLWYDFKILVKSRGGAPDLT